MMLTELAPCPCGKPWHLEDWSPDVRAAVEALIARHGEAVRVTIEGRSWWVPRRCIAYHGITGQQLLSGTSGFEERPAPPG